MDFELTDTQILLRNTARKLVVDQIEPLLARHDSQRPLPKQAVLEAYNLIQSLGFFGARIDEADGGSPLDYMSYGLLVETLPPVLTLSCMATEATAKRIQMGGTPEQKARFLPRLLGGELIAATAISEPNVGSDPRGIETTATADGDGYRLKGTKLWISNASISDLLIVVASTGRDANGRNLISRFLVERAVSPYMAREVEVIGLRQGHLSEVVLDDCYVPADNLLGETGDAHHVLTFTWLANRVVQGLMGVHLSQRSLDACLAYAKERRQFGKVIGSFQLVQAMLADMATTIEASRLLCYQALALLDKGVWCHKQSSMAKYFATEGAIRVTNLGMQVHGAYGLTRESHLEQYHRDACMLIVPDGTTQIQQLIIGRELLGIRAFS
jgi:alkylation response protein AidB-like acyl-CoA dehydrogenase